jgi:dynein heavy chain 2, cytosolic
MQVAEKFYHYGVTLQQVATFYNSVSEHMLECHKPCLLEYAKAFESICLQPCDGQGRPITWRDANALDHYLRRVDAARRVLVEKNAALRSSHGVLREQLALLPRLDLVSQRGRWLQVVEVMRRVFVRSEREFPRDLQVCFVAMLHTVAMQTNVSSKQCNTWDRGQQNCLPLHHTSIKSCS